MTTITLKDNDSVDQFVTDEMLFYTVQTHTMSLIKKYSD